MRRVLAGQAGVRDADSEMVGGVFDRNGGLVVVDEGKDVDTFVLAGLEGVAEEVPEFGCEEVLFGDKTQSFRQAVVDKVVAAARKWLEADEQVVDQVVNGNLDPAVGGFEG
jgi:hypothetical protein